MKIILYQNDPVFGEIERNVETAINAVGDEKLDVMVLPELFATGYQFENRDEAISLADETGEGFTFRRLKEFAKEKDCLVVYGFPQIESGRLFNSAMAILSDGSFHIYQKIHLFDTEKNIFDPGESGFFVFPFRNARFGIMICFDWRFPESSRKLALLGAQVILHPANLVLPHCPQAMIIRALENNVYTVTCNRVGNEDRTGKPLKFIGKSRIIAPDGAISGELTPDKPGCLAVEITPKLADNKKVTSQNDLFMDRRPEFY